MRKSNWSISTQVGIKLNKCLKPTPRGIEWHLSTHSSCTFWTPGHFLMTKVVQFKAKNKTYCIKHQSPLNKKPTWLAAPRWKCLSCLLFSMVLRILSSFWPRIQSWKLTRRCMLNVTLNKSPHFTNVCLSLILTMHLTNPRSMKDHIYIIYNAK